MKNIKQWDWICYTTWLNLYLALWYDYILKFDSVISIGLWVWFNCQFFAAVTGYAIDLVRKKKLSKLPTKRWLWYPASYISFIPHLFISCVVNMLFMPVRMYHGDSLILVPFKEIVIQSICRDKTVLLLGQIHKDKVYVAQKKLEGLCPYCLKDQAICADNAVILSYNGEKLGINCPG